MAPEQEGERGQRLIERIEVDMIYPQGKTIHQNLSAEYTDVPQLLSSLKGNGFSGVVEIEAGSRKGVFFMAAGGMVNAAIGVDSDPPAMVGDLAVQELFALARQPQGLLHVFELTTAEVEFATGPLNAELVFKELSTDFIRMDQFVKKLADEKHTGYIEIFSKDNRRIGALSFRNGDVVGLQTVSESGSMDLFEGESIPSVLDDAVRDGAVFSVYRSAGVSHTSPGTADFGSARNGAAAPKTQTPPPRHKAEAKPVSDPPVVEPPKEVQPAVETLAQKEPPVRPREPTPPTVQKEQPAPAAAEPPVEAHGTDDASANSRKEFISSLQRVLSKIESFADHITKKGDFQRLFRQTCVERSDIYHFLDPFEGQFEYDSGKIRLDDGVGSEDFALAAADCINLVLTTLNKEFLKGAALPPGLKGEIESAFRHYKETIKETGLQSVVPASMR